MAHILIEVEPTILKYARYCSGYDFLSASEKLKIPEEKLRQLEEKKEEISLAKVKKMASVYKMPLAYFLLKQAPKDLVLPKDFRIVYDSQEETLSHEVMMAIRKARYVQSVVQELQDNEFVYDLKSVSISDNAEQVAEYFRSLLGVTLDDQRKWSSPSNALRGWKDAIERLGIFVLQESLPENDISAFCIADQKPYILLLNSSEHENRRIFSLFHEIGHILLHRSGVCTPDNFSRNSFDYIKIEKFCNQFSAALLVPITGFIANDVVCRLRTIPIEQWNPDDVKSLATYYRVSQEVIYRRFVYVGILSESEYEKRRKELMESFREYKKLLKKLVIIPQYRKIISKNGRAYTTLVLQSMYKNKTTLSDVANFLGTTSIHISKVEANL